MYVQRPTYIHYVHMNIPTPTHSHTTYTLTNTDTHIHAYTCTSHTYTTYIIHTVITYTTHTHTNFIPPHIHTHTYMCANYLVFRCIWFENRLGLVVLAIPGWTDIKNVMRQTRNSWAVCNFRIPA